MNRLVAALLATWLGVPILLAAPPEWLLAAAHKATPALPAGATALILLDDTSVTVRPDGGATTVHRVAIRVLNRSGRDQANGTVSYIDKTERVDSAEAWLLRGGKEIRPPQRRPWVDVSTAGSGTVYSENRAQAINYGDLALDDDVFGFETRVTGRLQFAELGYEWSFSLPALAVSYTVQLPAGGTLESSITGPRASEVSATSAAGGWTWTLNDLPYRPDEAAAPVAARQDALLYATIKLPPAAGGSLTHFRSWADVRDWALTLQTGQCDTDPNLARTVQELTAGCDGLQSKVKALSRHVQGLRYVAIDKDLSKGFGARPRKATEVATRGWGDCKDKANLLRAMLREIGVEAFMAIARIGGGRLINDSWPTPWQFNHAILAIRVAPEVAAPAVIDVPQLGRVLFFDPTDNDTLLGDLPVALQGSKVFVLAPGIDALTELPNTALEIGHVFERRVRLQLDPSGAVVGECTYGGPGAVGAYYRRKVRTTTPKDLRVNVTDKINATVRGAIVQEFSTSDDPATGDCRFRCVFAALRFAQLMPGGMAVVRLDVLSRDTVPMFSDPTRRLAVELAPILQHDEVTLALPAGFAAEELPDRAVLQGPYGAYESVYTAGEGTVTVRRTLRIESRIVPVAEYGALRKFLQDVARADHASVVLRTSNGG